MWSGVACPLYCSQVISWIPPNVLGIFWLGVAISLAQSPPRLLPEAYDNQERVLSQGTNVLLSCPVEADPETLFFEWYRDREPLNLFADERFRVQGSGTLRIKNLLPEDTGQYVCRAVNGFGRADVNVTLIVLGTNDGDVHILNPSEDEQRIGVTQDERHHGNALDGKEDSEDNTGKPRLTEVSRFHGSVIQRLVGTSETLSCGATGNPKPQVSWLKNGKPLPDSNLRSKSRKGHWSLQLRNLQVSDTGNYTCHFYNALGSVNATFAIKVVDRVSAKLDFVQGYPRNVTAAKGDPAVLQCKLAGDNAPNVRAIQWLKQIPESETIVSDGHAAVKLRDEHFQVLKSTEMVEHSNGSFIFRLTISSVEEKDAGKYICLRLNDNPVGSHWSKSWRSAFLTVIERSDFLEARWTLPYPIAIGIAVSIAIIVSGLTGLVLYCRSSHRFHPVPCSSVTTATNATASSSSTTTTGGSAGHPKERQVNNYSKHAYMGIAYHPHIERTRENISTRVYIPNGHLHQTVPLNSIFL